MYIGNRFGTNIIQDINKLNYYRTLSKNKYINKQLKMTDVQETPKAPEVAPEKTDDSLLKVMTGLKQDNVKLMDMSSKLNEELKSQQTEIDEYKKIIQKYKLQEKNDQIDTLQQNGPGLIEKLKNVGFNTDKLTPEILTALNETVLHMNSKLQYFKINIIYINKIYVFKLLYRCT